MYVDDRISDSLRAELTAAGLLIPFQAGCRLIARASAETLEADFAAFLAEQPGLAAHGPARLWLETELDFRAFEVRTGVTTYRETWSEAHARFGIATPAATLAATPVVTTPDAMAARVLTAINEATTPAAIVPPPAPPAPPAPRRARAGAR